MKAVTVQFDAENNTYSKLLDTLINSWETNATIPLDVIRTDAPEQKTDVYAFDTNTRKLEIWANNFTEDTVFIDADMLLLDCIADGFDKVDYVGITDREGPIPINGGVMFFKYNKRGKRFMKDLVDVNRKMFEDRSFHIKWQRDKGYAGMNQSAIGYLIENEYKDYTLLPDIYNCCEPWTNWEQAKMIHVKGMLRIYCMHDQTRGDEHIMQIKNKWFEYASST